MYKKLTQEWIDWIIENVQRGVKKEEILAILLKENFEPTECKVILGIELDHSDILNAKKSVVGSLTYKANPDIDHENLKDVPAEIYKVHNFLNNEECDQIIKEIKSKLRPSTIASSGEYDATFRTSSTCDLGYMENDFLKNIDNKICELVGIESSYGETLQGQHYLIGQEFKAHTDYFEGSQLVEHDKGRGQRTYTVMIYLNEDITGGETEFPELDITFKPKTGMALIWNNLNEDGSFNANTIHQAHPVSKGEKTVITKWFRQKSV